MAGQGTAALELFEDAGELDALLVCVGGGGLLAGCATVATSWSPGCRVIGVEPAVRPALVAALQAGEPVRVEVAPTLADGQQTDMVLGLRYVDRFERRSGAWRIAARVCAFDWTVTVPFDPARGFRFETGWTLGARDRTDITYSDFSFTLQED